MQLYARKAISSSSPDQMIHLYILFLSIIKQIIDVLSFNRIKEIIIDHENLREGVGKIKKKEIAIFGQEMEIDRKHGSISVAFATVCKTARIKRLSW